MSFFSKLFSGMLKSGAQPAPKTANPNPVQFTNGTEEIRMALPQIAFVPPAGWSPYPGITQEQKPTDVRIASPSLLGKAGMITCLLFPRDTLSLADRVEQFLSKSNDTVAERAEIVSDTGIPITLLHLIGSVPGKEGRRT